MNDRRFYDASAEAGRRTAPAASRNVGPIGDVLAHWLPRKGHVLELASGTGEHALAYSRRFSAIEWQPSDSADRALESIEAWRVDGPANLLAPLRIDVAKTEWPVDRADALIAINLVHISPWETALGLLHGAARLLDQGAPLILYGPWIENGLATVPSNQIFDTDLRARDPRWGLRDLSIFVREAEVRGLFLEQRRAMPANNIMVKLARR